MVDIQPILTDEPITEPSTGRITIRLQDFLEALRQLTNETSDSSDQNNAVLLATVQVLGTQVNELTKKVEDLEQQINAC